MPALSTTINLPPDVEDQITSYAQRIGVDYLVSLALATVLSNGQNLPPNDAGQQGIMQVTPELGHKLGFDVTTQAGNIQCGLTRLANLYKTFVNYPFALAAYLTGPEVVFKYNNIPPFGNINALVYNIAALAQRAGCYSLTAKDVINQNKSDASPASTTTSALVQPTGPTNTPDNATTGQGNVTQSLQVNDGMNLNAKPWYDFSLGLVTGNPQIRKNIQPVSFLIYLSQATGELLTNPDTQKPIELQLNCSMTQFEIQSKHVFNRTPSRTGQHITFWGMQPDLINGSGSTGVFMNQFGLTDFFSVSSINDDVRKLVTQGFRHLVDGDTISTQSVNNPTVFNQIVNQVTDISNVDTAFRVAAQDAFVEFMKMFQMNGNVWFYNPNFSTFNAGTEQSTPAAWSPHSGTSSTQQNARNNDVHSRGYVAMKYKNNVYLGYFKSLNWTMDAEKPFQWQFNFTFQVERTYSALYFPTSFNFGQAQPSIATLPNEIV